MIASLTGWYVGFVIGAMVVAIVVVLFAVILGLARKIGIQAREVILALDASRANTMVLQAVPDVAGIVKDINNSAVAARGLLEAKL